MDEFCLAGYRLLVGAMPIEPARSGKIREGIGGMLDSAARAIDTSTQNDPGVCQIVIRGVSG